MLLAGFSTKALKEIISSAGLSFADCIDQADLRARAVEATERLRESAPKGGGASYKCPDYVLNACIALFLSEYAHVPKPEIFAKGDALKATSAKVLAVLDNDVGPECPFKTFQANQMRITALLGSTDEEERAEIEAAASS